MKCQVCGKGTDFVILVVNDSVDWICLRCYHWAVETLKRCVKRVEN